MSFTLTRYFTCIQGKQSIHSALATGCGTMAEHVSSNHKQVCSIHAWVNAIKRHENNFSQLFSVTSHTLSLLTYTFTCIYMTSKHGKTFLFLSHEASVCLYFFTAKWSCTKAYTVKARQKRNDSIKQTLSSFCKE